MRRGAFERPSPVAGTQGSPSRPTDRAHDGLDNLTTLRARGRRAGGVDHRQIVPRDHADERSARAAEAGGGATQAPADVSIRYPGVSDLHPHLIGAAAYTVGRDIVLAPGVDPHSASGSRIVAHELAHVEQAREQGDQRVRCYYADIANQSIGPDYARSLSEQDIEEDSAFLDQYRRGRPHDSIEYQVASGNLAVLGEEADRRGYKSVSLTRGTLLDLFIGVFDRVRETVQHMSYLKQEFDAAGWTVSWDPSRKAFQADPIEFAVDQLGWMINALSGTAGLINQTYETHHDTSLALLRMAGTRVSAVMMAYSELRPFLYFVQTAIAFRYNDTWIDPTLLGAPVDHARERITSDLAGFATLQPDRIDELAATSVDTTRSVFDDLQSFIHQRQPLQLKLPKLPRWLEATLIVGSLLTGVGEALLPEEGFALAFPGLGGFAMAGGGASAIATISVTAEQIEALRRLLAIGAISTSVIAAAGSGISLATQTDVPSSVGDLLGDNVADRMHVTGKRGAGMAARPRHHVMPQQYRAWFEARGMTGEALDIDNFTIDMDEAEHQAIHGGGNWQLGLGWEGNWNEMIMDTLEEAEAALGRQLTPDEILDITMNRMQEYGIAPDFIPYGAPRL
jgi:hypothetical protein